jgi:FkbM family methyltransferase
MRVALGRLLRRLRLSFLLERGRRALRLAAPGLAEGRRHRSMCRFYAQFISPGDVCFDLGAHVGDRSNVFLQLGATVVAVEPQPQLASFLRRRFRHRSRLMLEECAVGREIGVAQLSIGTATTLSSLSVEWMERVTQSGRFADNAWTHSVKVPVTTLDALIDRYGPPSFCKIDVEGFEEEVLAGLSQPIRTVSFEFTPECADVADRCIQALNGLGAHEFNISIGESMEFELADWVGAREIIEAFRRVDRSTFGDIYARIPDDAAGVW